MILQNLSGNMAHCKKLFYQINKNTGEMIALFLESKFNYFNRKHDWFLVAIIGDGKTSRRIERKISDELAHQIRGMI